MIDTQAKLFVQDMLKDAAVLINQKEYGQAFDKLARGIESQFNKLYGNSQSEKAAKFLERFADNEQAWNTLRENIRKIEYFCEELGYYVAKKESGKPQAIAKNITFAAEQKQQINAFRELASLILLIRNKRFHGHPDFSGRNIRVAMNAGSLMLVMQEILLQMLRDTTPTGDSQI